MSDGDGDGDGDVDLIRSVLRDHWGDYGSDAEMRAALFALDQLVSEMDEDGRDLMAMQERVLSLLNENQRLRDALDKILRASDEDEMASLARRALDGSE